MWMNQEQLKKKYADPEFQTAFVELFTLHMFLERCLFTSGFKPSEIFGDAISLTSKGKEWIPRIQGALKDISPSEVILALFVIFFHHELFIDVTATNAKAIRNVLDAEILKGNIRYPWFYGRILYDRFFDMFPTQIEELSYEETMKLLQDTPQGVFQLRDVLVGPFGVLNSSCHRFLLPTMTFPLWHCSDPSCDAIHPVILSSSVNKMTEAITFISNESEKAEGIPSDWNRFFQIISSGTEYYYDDMHPEQFPWLLASAFSETEIRNILRRLIDQYSKEIRQRFPKTKRFESVFSGSAEKISEGLSKAQSFQIILLMPDEIVADSLEYLIKNGTINIPSNEIRTLRVTYDGYNWLGVTCECSRFGVRFVSSRMDIALARLKGLITEIYKEQRYLTDLEWKLRHVPGESIYEKLDTFLHTEDPENIVSALILPSPDHIHRAFKILRYGWFELPSSSEEEKFLVEKILWKLGFNIGLYPPHQHLFWERLERLLETARTYSSYNQHDRELIRGAGVNFFVSLEEILDYSLSFITFALLSDHYGVTKFKFNFNEAREFMASRLSGYRQSSNGSLEFDAGGRNTLYPLIQGFAILAELCREITEARNGDLRRPENEFPQYHNNTQIEIFPFHHKVLVLDLSARDRNRVIELLEEITSSLDKSQICNIRNRIEHRRPNFPGQDEIEGACDMVASTISKMEYAGVCPLIYLYSSITTDKYGRNVITFKDYKSREIIIRHPSQYRLCTLRSLGEPQVIVPWIHLGDSSEMLRFYLEEISDYAEMWREYPRRRTIVIPEE